MLAALLVLGMASPALAQSPEQLKALKDKKLAGAWLKNAGWITDYDAAKAKAAESGKLMFGYFTRSYAP